MTIIRTVSIAAAAAVVFGAGCGGSKEPPAREESTSKARVQQTAPAETRPPGVDRDSGGGGDGATGGTWTEIGLRDVSYADVKRINATVLVPFGLNRQALSGLLTEAAREIAERERARAVLLDAFRWADEVREGTYSVGRVYWAPNGKWEDAARDDPMAAKVELGTLYFKEGQIYYSVSDEVRLAGAGGAAIELFRTVNTGASDQVVASLPDGTSAVVVERSIKVFGGKTEHVRYRVKVEEGGMEVTGWVAPASLRPTGGK